MDVRERTRICQLIHAVVAADGVVASEERAFLLKLANRFGIPDMVVDTGPVEDSAPLSDPGRASSLLRELAPDVRSRVMALLVESAVVDGHVHPAERTLLLVAAAALGFEADAVEQRIARRLAETGLA